MASIQIRSAIPGPRSQALMQRRQQAVARGVFHATPIFAARAEGAIVEDVDGNRYIDLAGGIGCSNVGHRAAPVLKRVQAQLERYMHTCFSVAPLRPRCGINLRPENRGRGECRAPDAPAASCAHG